MSQPYSGRVPGRSAAATLLGILEAMGKEVYTAVHDQLGAVACRILVPGYAEVYPVEDLIWDNTNKALLFREDILNLHRLDDELELDDYVVNFRRMFGNPRMDAVLGSVDGSVRFFGLTPTSMQLECRRA